MRNLVTAFALSVLVACRSGSGPRERLELCDHTTSSRCDEQSIRRAAHNFLKNLVPGSRFTVVLVACTSDQVETVYEINVPLHWGSGAAQKRRAWLEAEEAHLESLHLRRPERCSGIVGSIWRVSRLLQESERPVKELFVNSDFREVSAELGFNFEKEVPSPAAFLARIREKNLLPDLREIRVVIYGVHDDASPDSRRWTSQQAAALRAAWTAAFKAMGVDNVEFRAAAPWEAPGEVAWSGR
jgi:hypothetical protein